MPEAILSLLILLYGGLAVWGVVHLLQKFGVIEISTSENWTNEGEGPLRW